MLDALLILRTEQSGFKVGGYVEFRRRVGSTTALYSVGLSFIFRSGEQVSRRICVTVCPGFYIVKQYFQFCHDRFFRHCFQHIIH